MTLPECIERHNAADPTPIRRAAVGAITPKGDAALAGYRFTRALRALPPQERAEALALFSSDLRAVIADLAHA